MKYSSRDSAITQLECNSRANSTKSLSPGDQRKERLLRANERKMREKHQNIARSGPPSQGLARASFKEDLVPLPLQNCNRYLLLAMYYFTQRWALGGDGGDIPPQ